MGMRKGSFINDVTQIRDFSDMSYSNCCLTYTIIKLSEKYLPPSLFLCDIIYECSLNRLRNQIF